MRESGSLSGLLSYHNVRPLSHASTTKTGHQLLRRNPIGIGESAAAFVGLTMALMAAAVIWAAEVAVKKIAEEIKHL